MKQLKMMYEVEGCEMNTKTMIPEPTKLNMSIITDNEFGTIAISNADMSGSMYVIPLDAILGILTEVMEAREE